MSATIATPTIRSVSVDNKLRLTFEERADHAVILLHGRFAGPTLTGGSRASVSTCSDQARTDR